ncbi:hypothetical protein [Methanoculleus thermophilus]|jgi:hypothetical protein|uniref:Uncharacterized protein n=1 Tax=Methanoculleus thermophilus TaxID=2200 RepID=A0A1G8ZUM6_9EURY|nr:hypothetical protein [Methanoculleus thermophilus]SDK18829.1 hypothetical protein SAMN04488571_10526 [Methanoculleus thermophilus]
MMADVSKNLPGEYVRIIEDVFVISNRDYVNLPVRPKGGHVEKMLSRCGDCATDQNPAAGGPSKILDKSPKNWT